jgi:drug/metabolite transporter (DMT)-like permease
MLHGFLLSILSAACYGMSPILIKLGLQSGLSPLDLIQYRFVFAALLVLAYLLVTDRGSLRPSPATLAKAAASGIGLYALQSWCFLSALRYIPAATTSLILYFYPVVVTCLSAVLFRARPERSVLVSLAIVVLGCSLVSYDALNRSMDPRGIAYACVAMVVFSVYMVANQAFMRTERPLPFTLYVLAFVAATFCLIHDPLAMARFDGRQILICVLTGLVPTAMAVPLLYLAIGKIGSARVSIFSTFEPVTTLSAAAVFLGEAIDPFQIAGMFLIVGGIALPNFRLLTIRRAVAG